MKKITYIFFTFLLFSCTEKSNKKKEAENKLIEEQSVSDENNKNEKIIEISIQEKNLNNFLDSIKLFKILPTDTLEVKFRYVQLENFELGKNTIQIFKKDSFNIDWIKINSDKLKVENLKTINPRIDDETEEMFCNSIQKIKLYNFKSYKFLFIEFTSHPCTGLGCGVSDYLIYDLNNNQLSLFGNFRTADLDFYNFPFNNKINYISTEYQGDFHGATPNHFISRIYSLDNNGKFWLEKDSTGKEYYFEIITCPNDGIKEFEFKRNWF